MEIHERRNFNRQTLGSLLTFSLLETLFASDSFAREIQPLTSRWLSEVNELSRQTKEQELKQPDWQQKVEELLSRVDLPDLLRFIDFENLTKNLKFRQRGERAVRPKFPKVEGLPTELVFGHQLFALRKDRSVAPHGHNNMATAFLVLKGEFHGRHYDRIEDGDESMIVKPTIDRTFTPGRYSTISDYKDNVHWFKATSDTGFIFNIHVLNVDPQVKRGGRVYIDPNGKKLSGGRIEARKISASEANKLYG